MERDCTFQVYHWVQKIAHATNSFQLVCERSILRPIKVSRRSSNAKSLLYCLFVLLGTLLAPDFCIVLQCLLYYKFIGDSFFFEADTSMLSVLYAGSAVIVKASAKLVQV